MEIKNFDQFFGNSPIPMLIIDFEDYSVKNVNDEMLDLYGYSRDEMLDFTLFDLRPHEEESKLRERLSRIKSEISQDEGLWKHKKKNGEIIYASVIRHPITYKGDEKTYQLVMYNDITNELNAQQRFEMLFDHSLDGIMLTNPNGDILQANKAACHILGMSEEEIINKGREGIVAKDEKLERALKERSESGVFSGELTYIHKSGRKIPVELTTSVFTNYTGERRTSLIFRDITERKETERALKQEKEFTEIALNSLPGIFFLLNDRGELIRWNDHSTEVFGLTHEEIEGRAAEEFVHQDDKQLIRDEIKKVFEKGHTRVELKLNTAEGTTAIYEFIANRFRQNGNTYIVGSGVDISKQKRLETWLQSALKEEHSERLQAEASRDKLKKMFEEAPSPKCLLEGPDMRFVIANKAYREVVGQEDIIGKRVIDVIPEVERQGYIDILNRVFEKGETYLGREEHIHIDKEGKDAQENYIFNLVYEPLFDDNGEVYGIFVEAMDFSEQIAYQEKLEESLKEKNTLLQEIHHRVKNNLAVVSSMMELQALESDDEALLDSLRTGQQRIQTIASIHNLLYQSDTLSHLNFGETVNQIADNLHGLYSSDREISLDLHIDRVNMNVNQAIPCALILNELLTNAYKHAFVNQSNGKVGVHLSEDPNKVYLSVTDNGVGIQESVAGGEVSSLGFTMINNLKMQLDASLEISRNGGTHCSLSFEKSEVKGIGSAILT